MNISVGEKHPSLVEKEAKESNDLPQAAEPVHWTLELSPSEGVAEKAHV